MFLITKINNNDNLSRLSGSVAGGIVIASPGVSQAPGSARLEVLISSTGPGTWAVHVTLVGRGSETENYQLDGITIVTSSKEGKGRDGRGGL